MRTYSKSQDFRNRLKLAALIIAIGSIAMWLTSCSENEKPFDPAKGTWNFKNDNTELKFTLSNYPYIVSDVIIKLDETNVINNKYEVTASGINVIQDILFRCEGGIVRIQDCAVNENGIMECGVIKAAGQSDIFKNKETVNITLSKE
jgi:hypothetical protein